MATVSVYFEPSKVKEDSYSVHWSIRHLRQCRTFASGVVIPKEYVDFLKSHKDGFIAKPKNRIKQEELIQVWNIIYGDTFISESGRTMCGYVRRAQIVIDRMGDNFSFQGLKIGMSDFNPDFTPVDERDIDNEEKYYVLDYLIEYRKKMLAQERFGYANSFRDTQSSLERFMEYKKVKKQLEFKDITVDFLIAYEIWMKKYGKAPKKAEYREVSASINTIGVYCRNIRTLFNIAINETKVIHKDLYPFGKYGFLIPKARAKKKARTMDDIEVMIRYTPKTAGQAQAKAFWLFSYLCNGANTADIANLKWRDLDEGAFAFVRRKTMRTKKVNTDPIEVFMDELAVQIIEIYGNHIFEIAGDKVQNDPEEYVFTIIDRFDSPNEKHKKIKQFIRNNNARMKTMCKAAGLSGSFNTMVARHSFATIMQHLGADIITISKMLGHSSITTTMTYLEDFSENIVRSQLRQLIPNRCIKPDEEPRTKFTGVSEVL